MAEQHSHIKRLVLFCCFATFSRSGLVHAANVVKVPKDTTARQPMTDFQHDDLAARSHVLTLQVFSREITQNLEPKARSVQ